MDIDIKAVECYLNRRLTSATVKNQYMCAIKEFVIAAGGIPGTKQNARSAITMYIENLPACRRTVGQAALHALFEFVFGVRFGKRHARDDYQPMPAILCEVGAFRAYLKENAFLAESTLNGACSTVKHFLCYTFPDGKLNLDTVDEQKIIRFLSKDKAGILPSSKKVLIGRLRSYARFLLESGHVSAARITGIPLALPAWSRAGTPKVLNTEQIESIKSVAASSYRAPLRNAAIVTCFVNLGLRTCEVAELDLDDIDFLAGCVSIHETKSSRSRRLPLDQETCNALTSYIIDERIPVAGVLFLRHLHDAGTPMGSVNLRMTVRGIARRAGIDPFGLHMLRHTAASRMVNNGVPLKVIADVLGHEEVQTTMTYAKIDEAHLKLVCAQWPGDFLE